MALQTVESRHSGLAFELFEFSVNLLRDITFKAKGPCAETTGNNGKTMHKEIQNIFDNVPYSLTEELSQTIATKNNIRIERIVSEGQATAIGEWYDQAWDEWVLLLSGSAELLIEGDSAPRSLKPGDYIMIPAGCRHRVEWTNPDQKTVWLAVHIGES